ncbi:MAG: hypothetical protein L3J47_09340 [Sulfurovum sp.]|nr:hypothetical protein [Sulfurovum sp.]
MRNMMLFLFFVSTLLMGAEFKRLGLHEIHDIVVIEESYDIYDSKGKVARFYQEEDNGNLTHLFNLTLEDKTGTCSARSVEEGSYEVNGTTLTLYTKWDRQGRIYDVPYGFRVMRYHVDENGTVARIESRIYVETSKKGFDAQSDIRFLFTQPKNQTEKEALQRYIKRAQQRFKGTFVLGNDAKTLEKEVNGAMMRKMQKRWQ